MAAAPKQGSFAQGVFDWAGKPREQSALGHTLDDVNYIWSLEGHFCLIQVSICQIVMLNVTQSLRKHPGCGGKRTGLGSVKPDARPERPGLRKPRLARASASPSVQWATAVLGMRECPWGFISGSSAAFWTMPDTVPTQLWQATQRGGLMKEAGVREHQRLKDAPKRVWALFSWRAGPAKPIRGPEQLRAREAAGSKGFQVALSHPLPHQLVLCRNSKLPIKPPSLFSFHSPAHLPLLFSPFLSKLIINRSRQK